MRLASRVPAVDSKGNAGNVVLPDPDGMYARATKGNLVEKSPGKCAECAKKLDKNWFRCFPIQHDMQAEAVSVLRQWFGGQHQSRPW